MAGYDTCACGQRKRNCATRCRDCSIQPVPLSVYEARFWDKVAIVPDGCWEWLASKNKRGYGKFGIKVRDKFRTIGAHRFAYTVSVGDPGELFVCHDCDNPGCVRPSHLWLGTNEDNVHDMDRKRRRITKLSPEQVLEVRRLRATGCTLKVLADHFGVTFGQIGHIAHGRLWKNIA